MLSIGISLVVSMISLKLFSKRKEVDLIKTLQEENQKLEFQLLQMTTKIMRAKAPNFDSLHYAIKVKNAFMPDINTLSIFFSEHFLIDKPKNEVGGDFYWFNYNSNILRIVVADCTGHSVPGALTSILVLSYLENKKNNHSLFSNPQQLFESLDKRIKENLNDDERIANGADIALCEIDFSNEQIQFTGAFSDIVIIQGNVLQVVSGTRRSVGANPKNIAQFETHTISFDKGDKIYFFTDGYYDQFGGVEGRKIKKRKFIELIDENKGFSMEKQKEFLEQYLNNWMHPKNQDSYEQIDDILILGMKL